MSGSCFDCPFRRDSTPGDLPNNEDAISFLLRIMSEDDQGEYSQVHKCPESAETCHGQKILMRNCTVGMMHNPLSEFYDEFVGLDIDHENYFSNGSEFTAYHENNGKFYGAEWFLENYGRGNKKRLDSVPVLPR